LEGIAALIASVAFQSLLQAGLAVLWVLQVVKLGPAAAESKSGRPQSE
jgi:hypothetical protein